MTVAPANPTSTPASYRQSLAEFVQFAATALGVESDRQGDVLELSFDHNDHPAWPKPYQVRVSLESDNSERLPRKVIPSSEGLAWLWKLAEQESGALVGRPRSQPESVHEFSAGLFDAYQVEGGQTQLGGCRIHEVPFLRVTTIAEDNPHEVVHRFFDSELAPVEESLAETLDLRAAVPLGDHPTSFNRSQNLVLAEKVRQQQPDLVALTVVVAKRAEVVIQFNIGEQCSRTTCEDWTKTIAAPPFRCAASGLESYHLAALDDGRIVAAEAIGTCEHSGLRMLDSELVTCAATGLRVDPQLASRCGVSDTMVLNEHLVECPTCGQMVSRSVIERVTGICSACGSLPIVAASDPLVAELLSRYPLLKKYGKLRASEVGGVVRVMALGWWRRLLLTIPAGSTQPSRVCMRQGLAGDWAVVPPAEWPQLLGAVD